MPFMVKELHHHDYLLMVGTDTKPSAWYKIIESVSAPLGFFVLALLIIESFLAIVLVGGNLDIIHKITGMWLGIGLFVLVTVLVFFLVWFKPENLTFNAEDHIRNKGTAVERNEPNPDP